MKELVFHSLLHQLEDPEMANKAPFIFIWWEEGAEEKSVGLGGMLMKTLSKVVMTPPKVTWIAVNQLFA